MAIGHTQVIRITIQLFTLKNINIFYFEMSGQIAIWLFSIKKARTFLNSQMAILLYTSHSAVHTQTESQTESEAFKTHHFQNVLIFLQPANEVWGKIIFLHLFVILFTGGFCLSACSDTNPPPPTLTRHPSGTRPPRTRHSPEPGTPRTRHPPRTGL